jgi:hypothetical protein
MNVMLLDRAVAPEREMALRTAQKISGQEKDFVRHGLI